MHYHRNAKTNIEQRRRIKKSAQSSRELAEQYCISHTTAAKWRKCGHLEDASSRPRTIHYALSKHEERLIIKLREHAFSLDEILDALLPYISTLKRSTCYRTLVRYKRGSLNAGEQKKRRTFSQYKPGFLHIDLFYLPKIEKKRYYCFLAIDRATRMVFLEVYPRKGKREAGDFLVKCLRFFPFRIHRVLTDNGAEFTARGQRNRWGKHNRKLSLFEAICAACGIKAKRTKPRHPWTNGMAERMVRTVKEHTTSHTRYGNVPELIADVKRFESYHNSCRKLSMIGRKTPHEKVLEWYEKDQEIFLKPPAAWKERGET